jgi:hypothetical protein
VVINCNANIGWKISAKMDFDDYDRVDEDQLNRILWGVAEGPQTPYPPIVRRAVFGP